MAGYPQQGHYDEGYQHHAAAAGDAYYQDDHNQGYYDQGHHDQHGGEGYYDDS